MGAVLTLLLRGRGLAGVLALAGVCLAGQPATASATGRWVDVRLIDRDSSQPLPVYRHHGQGHTPGRPGSRYAIALRNLTGERLLVVLLSVDGVNVVTGQTAHWNQSGYVLDPYQSYEITGWRKSRSEVAAFEFTELRDSYAARTGRPFDVGVVGAAAFRERRPAWREEPELSQSQSAPRPLAEQRSAEKSAGAADLSRESAAATAPAPGERLGTGHGDRETSWVRHTRFERARSTPDEVVALRYDSFENLVAAGVVPRRQPEPHGHPRPFPEAPSAGYVPDPPRRWSQGW